MKETKKEIEEKDQEIIRLTKEVVELRLYKASLNSPDERTESSDAPTIRENDPFSPQSPSKDLPDEGGFETATSPGSSRKRVPSEVPSSLADSGHFEDGSIHSKESVSLPGVNAVNTNITSTTSSVAQSGSSLNTTFNSIAENSDRDGERRRLVAHYESRIEEMHRRHVDELQELKEKHNDKVLTRTSLDSLLFFSKSSGVHFTFECILDFKILKDFSDYYFKRFHKKFKDEK